MPHDQQPQRDLHSLVGLGRHATIDELRWAYEKAMAVATRSGNHDHAVRLSRAYDALSGATRRQVYDARGALRCAAHRELGSELESVPTVTRRRRYRSPRLNLSVSRAVAAVLSVLAVVLTAVLGWAGIRQGRHPVGPVADIGSHRAAGIRCSGPVARAAARPPSAG